MSEFNLNTKDQVRCGHLSSLPTVSWMSEDSECTFCHCTHYQMYSCSAIKCAYNFDRLNCKTNEYLETSNCCPYCQDRAATIPTRCWLPGESNVSIVPNSVLTENGCGHSLVCHNDGLLRYGYYQCLKYSMLWCFMFCFAAILFIFGIDFINNVIIKWIAQIENGEELEINDVYVHDNSQHSPYYKDYKHVDDAQYQTLNTTWENPANDKSEVQIV